MDDKIIGLLKDPRRFGAYIIYEMLQQVTKTTIEEIIVDFKLDPFDIRELQDEFLKKDIIYYNIPTNWKEEMDALDWLSGVRKQVKTIPS